MVREGRCGYQRGAGGGRQCAGSSAVVGGCKGVGPTGRALVVVLAENPTYRKPGRGGVIVELCSKALGEKDKGSGVGIAREPSEEEVAPLPVGRVIQEADRLREDIRAVEVLAGLVAGCVADSVRMW